MPRRNLLLLMLSLAVPGTLPAYAQGPASTELPGKIYSIKQTWTIGGEGNWDYLAFDPDAVLLYVAHGPVVQVVDVKAGQMAAQIVGMRDAHGIALDDSGQFGYISDGPANRVQVFDRRSNQVVASIPTGPNPRAVVYEPLTKLVFAICTQPLAADGSPKPQNSPPDADSKSVVTVIDSETRLPIANLLLPGKLGFAQSDGRGQIFINIVDRSQIGYFDAQTIDAALRHIEQVSTPAPGKPRVPPAIDWSGYHPGSPPAIENRLQTFNLGSACRDPRGLAIDAEHFRVFAACDNRKLEVLNSGNGQVVATLNIGPGTDAIAYDASRGLIFTANGGGLGSVTVIHQSMTDSYNVIQELPTRQRARTLAINPSSGEIYLVTNLQGFDTRKKGQPVPGDVPVVAATPVAGSFQVLVLGN
jgi:YVTN family beta-propeller protein